MSDERLQILKMLEQGKVTADEALRLLEAVEPPAAPPPPSSPRHVRVVVREGRSRAATVRVPMSVVQALGRMAELTFPGVEVPWARVEAAIRAGLTGMVAEVADGDRRVEIFLD